MFDYALVAQPAVPVARANMAVVERSKLSMCTGQRDDVIRLYAERRVLRNVCPIWRKIVPANSS